MIADLIVDGSNNIEDILDAKELAESLERSLNKLPPRTSPNRLIERVGSLLYKDELGATVVFGWPCTFSNTSRTTTFKLSPFVK